MWRYSAACPGLRKKGGSSIKLSAPISSYSFARSTATCAACWVTERMLVPPYLLQVSTVSRAIFFISSSVSL